ncbi:MAG TPA: lactate utilization protein [Desulfotignum sp.]|nr:lactate utilization protein [Desulfotignum sp.]
MAEPTTGRKKDDSAAVFTQKASLVSACVHGVKDWAAALDKTLALLAEKPPLDPQVPSEKKTDPSARILAAPNLDHERFRHLSEKCGPYPHIQLIRDNLRNFPGGIDMGVTTADYGIADTGTLVINSNEEETRLATMLCEVHVAILGVSDIRETALSMTGELAALTREKGSYTAFVTGASRTADIERVLAIGVHGPLELHIILVEDD